MSIQQIVVADDDPYIRNLLVEALEDEGYAARACADGCSALEEIRRLRPQLAILDVAMPGMTGDAVLQQLRAEGFCRPILLVTAATRPMRFLALGANKVLPKPFDLPTLLDTVATLLGTSSSLNGLALGEA